ncbi:MAG: isocitrate/isopropylmalate dehydrogenase family protein [Candidatus Omnitrophica bacterium]|nr:isocitrate/isopropylmalate dehydrogenase family protein [Candidatus Omnitrophota bacterium]
MSTHKVTLIPGDGIGPEVAAAARKCVDATGVKIDWEIKNAGSVTLKEKGEILPQEVLDSIRKNKVALKGPIITPVAGGYRSVNVQLRQKLDLFVCLRPAKAYPGIRSINPDIDILIFRENTEDLYAGIEFEKGSKEVKGLINLTKKTTGRDIKSDSAISLKPISESASKRLFTFAFEYAIAHKRKKITAVHKANIMKYSDGLFLECGRQIASKYKGKIDFEETIVDNLSMQLVLRPTNFDCLALPNLYGDIISDLCAGLVGGLGVAPGANIGDELALFEPVHGAAPKYTGKNKVNPAATILSAVMMLDYLNEKQASQRLKNALIKVVKEGKSVTYDLKPDRNDPTAVGTSEMAEAIIKEL